MLAVLVPSSLIMETVVMAVTPEELDHFHRFSIETLANGGADLTLEDLVDLWRAENPREEELKESLASLRRGLADAEAGRVYAANEVLDELRQGVSTKGRE